MPRFRRRRFSRQPGYSTAEEANIEYLKGKRVSPKESARLREELPRLELKVAQQKQKIAVLMAANRTARQKAVECGGKAAAFRATIDRRIGRYTLDVVIFALIAVAWWFGLLAELIQARG
jgi:hypothetical protein